MTRESCITHNPKQAISIVRQDYYELTDRDACAAALLNVFEYWANAALAADATVERPWVGARPIREFEQMLLGIATDKQIRKRLALLEERGFIQTKAPAKRGAAKEYQVLVPEIQRALVGQMTHIETAHRSHDQNAFGQMTGDEGSCRPLDRPPFGQMTSTPSVKQPTPLRSNDRALKNKSKELKKEDLKEASLVLFEAEQDAAQPFGFEQTEVQSPIQVGGVQYSQSPETIDLAELWATNPGMAKTQLRFIAPGHKRLEMVAHGFGQWWVGPSLNDFNEFLVKACQQRKRKFQQPDGVGDAKTFINNMTRNGDWANLALRCDEALLLQESAAALSVARADVEPKVSGHSPFERSPAERRDSALGLARFKVAQGDIERAIAISQQFGLSRGEIGLTDVKPLPTWVLSAA